MIYLLGFPIASFITLIFVDWWISDLFFFNFTVIEATITKPQVVVDVFSEVFSQEMVNFLNEKANWKFDYSKVQFSDPLITPLIFESAMWKTSLNSIGGTEFVLTALENLALRSVSFSTNATEICTEEYTTNFFCEIFTDIVFNCIMNEKSITHISLSSLAYFCKEDFITILDLKLDFLRTFFIKSNFVVFDKNFPGLLNGNYPLIFDNVFSPNDYIDINNSVKPFVDNLPLNGECDSNIQSPNENVDNNNDKDKSNSSFFLFTTVVIIIVIILL